VAAPAAPPTVAPATDTVAAPPTVAPATDTIAVPTNTVAAPTATAAAPTNTVAAPATDTAVPATAAPATAAPPTAVPVPPTAKPTVKPTAKPVPPTSAPAAKVVSVREVDFAFAPASITIDRGTTIEWTNIGPTDHTVADDKVTWSSDILKAGQKYSHTFNTPGTITVICTLHPDMISTVIVK
nr:plastocyanin/azurin family copper-binding protein [Chloroflexota bacterium]